jgi:O-antigen ligase
MLTTIKEAKAASILAWGSVFVTLIVTDRVSSEPANLGKMLVLAAIGFAILPLIFKNVVSSFNDNRILLITISVFLLFSLVSVFMSENPFERGFYGTFGRNTGFLSYLVLAIVFLAGTQLFALKSFHKVIKALLIAGLLNVIVSILSSMGIQVFTWNIPENSIVGTFGNSNFIGAFMGMFVGILCVLFIATIGNWRNMFFVSISLVLALYVVFLSDALQGLLISLTSFVIVIFFYLRSNSNFKILTNAYVILGFVTMFFGIAGILNKGPLASLLYKPSITFRWEYWSSGINMGLNNPIFGLGIDSYGSYYRTYRNESATILPGVDVTTDAAHNVVIDIFAGTGIIGVLSYLIMNIIVFYLAYSRFKTNRKFDPILLSLFIPWIGYQIQSLISINQLGLAVWGWLLGGAIVGYVKNTAHNQASGKIETKMHGKGKKVVEPNQLLPAGTALSIFAMTIAGILISLPPFIADAKMRSIMGGESDSSTLIAHAKAFPVEMNRLNRATVALANSGLNVQAAELALYGTTRFPNDYASWYSLYELSGPGTPDAEVYRKKLQEIDPYNPKYFDK